MRRKGVVIAGAVVATAVGIWLTVETRRNKLVWDHWDVVKAGVLYRSGQLEPEQLQEAIRRYGIKTVVNFQFPGPPVDDERAVAEQAGAAFVNLPMPGDGFGREEQFREVLAACEDPARRPVLVHCARGTCRTGAAVGLFRLERDGWTLPDVAAEMERQAYKQGWLPGYVYGMIKPENRPDMIPFAPGSALGGPAPTR